MGRMLALYMGSIPSILSGPWSPPGVIPEHRTRSKPLALLPGMASKPEEIKIFILLTGKLLFSFIAAEEKKCPNIFLGFYGDVGLSLPRVTRTLKSSILGSHTIQLDGSQEAENIHLCPIIG